MEQSLRRSVRPTGIYVKSSNARGSEVGQRGGVSPVQQLFTKTVATPSLSEQKMRHYSGNSYQQQHHSSSRVIKDSLPQQVHALQNFTVERVICGSDSTFVITAPSECESSRHCFSWGCNSHGQLGHSFVMRADLSLSSNKTSMQKVQTPTLIDGLDGANITHLTCGNTHAFAWSQHD